MKSAQLKALLDEWHLKYNRPEFITDDPLSIPHLFSKAQDREISGLFAALLAWGQRKTIINNCLRLMEGMDHAPHDFILNHEESDRARFEKFVHRTFQYPDLLYFLEFLQHWYRNHASLEDAFLTDKNYEAGHMGPGLVQFNDTFFSMPHLPRTQKHLQTPARGSACKRLNLYLRWMVRNDGRGVDLGIWKRIDPALLLCPLDVHVHRAATELGLLNRKQADWTSTLELTARLKKFCPEDPVKYDFALFGMSIEKNF